MPSLERSRIVVPASSGPVKGCDLSGMRLDSCQASCLHDNGFWFVGRYLNPEFPNVLDSSEVQAIAPYMFIGLFYEVSGWTGWSIDQAGRNGAQAAQAAFGSLVAAGGGAGDGAIFCCFDGIAAVWNSQYSTAAAMENYLATFLSEMKDNLGEHIGIYTSLDHFSTMLGWAEANGFTPYTWLAYYNGSCGGAPILESGYTFQQYQQQCAPPACPATPDFPSCPIPVDIDMDAVVSLSTPALR
ncbi:MAG: glycoside hydrolase family 25 domain-containing protein [Sulfobacillus sp.]